MSPILPIPGRNMHNGFQTNAYTHAEDIFFELAMIDKTAELSQRRSRDAPNR